MSKNTSSVGGSFLLYRNQAEKHNYVNTVNIHYLYIIKIKAKIF